MLVSFFGLSRADLVYLTARKDRRSATMSITNIGTPSDFERVLHYHDFAVWDLTHLTKQEHAAVVAEMNQMFSDLNELEIGDSEQQVEFIESVEEPLARLAQHHCRIMAILSSGTMRLEGGAEIPDWVRAHFLIVPVQGSFRIGDSLTSQVHRFDVRCECAMGRLRDAVRDGLAVHSWSDDRQLTVDYEGAIPWCPQCLQFELAE